MPAKLDELQIYVWYVRELERVITYSLGRTHDAAAANLGVTKYAMTPNEWNKRIVCSRMKQTSFRSRCISHIGRGGHVPFSEVAHFSPSLSSRDAFSEF